MLRERGVHPIRWAAAATRFPARQSWATKSVTEFPMFSAGAETFTPVRRHLWWAAGTLQLIPCLALRGSPKRTSRRAFSGAFAGPTPLQCLTAKQRTFSRRAVPFVQTPARRFRVDG